MGRTLEILYDEVTARSQVISDARDGWPCERGCGDCCRRLFEPPRLVRQEWERMQLGLGRLDPVVRERVERDIRILGEGHWATAAVVCPLLDQDHDTCRVYSHRPAACRSYGFYASRRHDLWCGKIDALLEETGRDDLVLGNQDALDRSLAHLDGPPRTLHEWLSSVEPTAPVVDASPASSEPRTESDSELADSAQEPRVSSSR